MIKSILTGVLMALLASSAFATTLRVTITHDGSCVEEDLPCPAVTEFRVYETDGTLIGSVGASGQGDLTLDYSAVVGTEYCYDAAGFNGEEGVRLQACKVYEIGRPTAPTVIDMRFQ